MAVYANGRIAIFPVIDRGPYTDGVALDLTRAAARRLGVTTTQSVRFGW
jgi:rare lipoprotein A (peptidoglycan hydrolase)